MSNTIAHLDVANRILKLQPSLVNNVDAFFLGSVAPDTIGSKPDVSREDKRRVHLREGIRDSQWLDDGKMCLFKDRIQHFANEYILNKSGIQRDFNIGYFVHLLTDEWNHRTIRQIMLRIAKEQNVMESDREFFNMMTNDLEALDNYLLHKDAEILNILNRLLGQDVQCALDGFIEKSYICGSIQWWKTVYLPNIKQRKLKYISKADIDDFVSCAAQEISNEINRLL